MALVAERISCERNGRLVFRDLSVQVEAGECIELRGPNGSGKSSLLRVIAGLVPMQSGRLQLDDQDDVAQHCHYAGHQDALKNQLTVAENLAFWALLFSGELNGEALQSFGIQPLLHESVAILSAGQRRRVALTRLLLAKRKIWLLDEPTSALDAQSQKALSLAINDHRKIGGIVILATHENFVTDSSRTLILGDPQ